MTTDFSQHLEDEIQDVLHEAFLITQKVKKENRSLRGHERETVKSKLAKAEELCARSSETLPVKTTRN
jgi:hypothetical protein